MKENNNLKMQIALEKYGCYYDYYKREEIKNNAYNIIESNATIFEKTHAWFMILKTYFFRSVEATGFNSKHPDIEKYIAMLLNGNCFKERMGKQIYDLFVEQYGKLAGIENGKTYYKII